MKNQGRHGDARGGRNTSHPATLRDVDAGDRSDPHLWIGADRDGVGCCFVAPRTEMYKGSLAEFGLLPAARCRVIANELRLDLPGLATEVETIRDPPDLPSDGP